MYRDNFNNLFILSIIVVILIIVSIFAIDSHKMDYTAVVNDEEEMLIMLTRAGEKYVTKINFNCSMDPSEIDVYELFRRFIDNNYWVGCELYGYDFTYSNGGGIYNVSMNMDDPSFWKIMLSKHRTKQIAKKLNELPTDYDKVKVAHDYIIILNEYSYSVCGAFNGYYSGKCACNGYAYTFYEIMRELDIPVTCEFGASHVWNKVCLDGEWYNIDLTWDDGTGNDVKYDYFLKCDNDWKNHEHGGATATQSYEVTDESAVANYSMIPNYKMIEIISGFVIFLGVFIGVSIYRKRNEL